MEKLDDEGLPYKWHSGEDVGEAPHRIGGSATLVGRVSVPSGSEGNNGALSFKVEREDAPPLTPVAFTCALKMHLELSPKGDDVLFRAIGRRAPLGTLPSATLPSTLMDFVEGGWRLPVAAGPKTWSENAGPEYKDRLQQLAATIGHDRTPSQGCDTLCSRRSSRRSVMIAVASDIDMTDADASIPAPPPLVVPGAPAAVKRPRNRPVEVLRRWVGVLKKTIYVQLAAIYEYLSMELLRQSGMNDCQLKEIATAGKQHCPQPHQVASLVLVRGRRKLDSRMKAPCECMPAQFGRRARDDCDGGCRPDDGRSRLIEALPAWLAPIAATMVVSTLLPVTNCLDNWTMVGRGAVFEFPEGVYADPEGYEVCPYCLRGAAVPDLGVEDTSEFVALKGVLKNIRRCLRALVGVGEGVVAPAGCRAPDVCPWMVQATRTRGSTPPDARACVVEAQLDDVELLGDDRAGTAVPHHDGRGAQLVPRHRCRERALAPRLLDGWVRGAPCIGSASRAARARHGGAADRRPNPPAVVGGALEAGGRHAVLPP